MVSQNIEIVKRLMYALHRKEIKHEKKSINSHRGQDKK